MRRQHSDPVDAIPNLGEGNNGECAQCRRHNNSGIGGGGRLFHPAVRSRTPAELERINRAIALSALSNATVAAAAVASTKAKTSRFLHDDSFSSTFSTTDTFVEDMRDEGGQQCNVSNHNGRIVANCGCDEDGDIIVTAAAAATAVDDNNASPPSSIDMNPNGGGGIAVSRAEQEPGVGVIQPGGIVSGSQIGGKSRVLLWWCCPPRRLHLSPLRLFFVSFTLVLVIVIMAVFFSLSSTSSRISR